MLRILGKLNLISGQARTVAVSKRRRRASLRPCLESLEQRLVLTWDITGTWTGTLTDSLAGDLPPSSPFLNLKMNLMQSTNNITGTAHVSFPDQPQYYDDFNLTGSFDQLYDSFSFQETTVNSKNAPAGAFYWSTFFGNLGLSSDGKSLTGFWSDYLVGGLEGGSIAVNGQAVETRPVLAVDNVTVTPDGQTVTATYTVSGTTLDMGAIDFYWAKGPNLSDKLGTAVPIGAEATVGTHTASIPITMLRSRPANASYILAVADSPDADPNHMVVSTPVNTVTKPIIAMKSATVSSDGQTVSASYSITGSNLVAPSTIDFYWGSGPKLSDAIDPPPPKKVTAETAVGLHAASVSIADLGPRPANALYILAVADSSNADPLNNVASALIPLPEISPVNVAADDSTDYIVDYTIASADFGSPIQVGVYRSPTATFDPSTAQLTAPLVTLPLFDASVKFSNIQGEHIVKFHIQPYLYDSVLPGFFDPNNPYVFVVLNPPATPPTNTLDKLAETAHSERVGVITVSELQSIMVGLSTDDANSYLDPLNNATGRFGIFTYRTQAAFLGQMAVESANLSKWEEAASRYSGPNFEHYDGVVSLGNTEPGDGKKFRGRGPMQLTGRYNYTYAGQELGYDFVANPELLADKQNPLPGFLAAAWFWDYRVVRIVDQGVFKGVEVRYNKLNQIADSLDRNSDASIDDTNTKVTAVINPRLLNLNDRRTAYIRALDNLGAWWRRYY